MMAKQQYAQVESINRTPAAPPLDGRDLEWLIEQYLDDRRTKVVVKTAQSYECRFRIFLEWWSSVGPLQRWMLTAADLGNFEHWLRSRQSAQTGKPLAYTYRKGVLQSLCEMLRWACEQGYTIKDYSTWVPAAYGTKKKRRAASEADLLKLLAECDNSPRRIRDRAMIAVFIGMGLRRAEVSNLAVEDIHFQPDMSGHADVTGKRTKANPTGERESAFDSVTGMMIAEHVTTLPYKRGPLFMSYRDKPMETYTVYGIVKKLIKRAGLEEEIQACHDLRRAFATHFARTHPDPRSADILRRQLGHSSYSMTAEYTLLEVDDLRRNITSTLSRHAGEEES